VLLVAAEATIGDARTATKASEPAALYVCAFFMLVFPYLFLHTILP
jgi:hypothetical protein